jgi:hypothetical protein
MGPFQRGRGSRADDALEVRPPVVTNVVFVLGSMRSGSSVLEQYLARAAGTVGMGEVVNVWDDGRLENRLCTCGEPFHSCSVWSEIMTAVERRMGGPDEVERIGHDLARDLWRLRLPLLLHHPWSRSEESSRHYREQHRLLGVLYEEIGSRSGAPLILDSSKMANYGHFLSRLENVRVAYVVLVRDSRAVANSWQRVKLSPQGLAGGLTPRPYPLAVREWVRTNLVGAALFPYAGSRMIAVTYEEFVRDPEATVGRINGLLSRLGMPVLGAPVPDGPGDRYHSFSGNPGRFDRGAPLVEDSGWRTEMPRGPRLAVTIATAPLLWAHHLLLWARSRHLAPKP